MTHHSRPDIQTEGGTTFHFVAGTPQEVLEQAREAAGDQDICLRGGVRTVRDFFREGLIDEAHIVIAPILLGKGENLWEGLTGAIEQYDIVEAIGTGNVAHLRIVRKPE